MTPTTVGIALTADQLHSRQSPDRVPEALEALRRLPLTLAFERTAGDEIQALATDAETAVAACELLAELGEWRIGLGVGRVEAPLPASTREARGTAYLAAREAVAAAHQQGIAVRAAESGTRAQRADSVAIVWQALVSRRSPEGWEVVRLLRDEGLTGKQAAERLGISASAVSQRLSRADHVAGQRARGLFVDLLTDLVEVQ